jgi:hypothetical protein
MWMVWAALACYTVILIFIANAQGGAGWEGSGRSSRWGWTRMDVWVSDLMIVLLLLSVLVALAAAVFTMHVRESVEQWRGQLLPGYRRINLAIGAAALVAVVAYVPVAMWLATGIPLFGLAAFLAAVAAAVAWSEYLQTVRATLPFLLAALFLVGGKFSTPIAAMVLGREPDAAAVVLLLAVAAVAALGWRMATRAELRAVQTMPGEVGLHRATVTSWSVERRLENLRNVSHAGFWRRVWHWRTVTGAQRVTWLFALAYAAVLSAGPWLAGGNADDNVVRATLIVVTLVCPLLVAALGGEEGLWRRRGSELLWPESRRRLVGEVLAASAIDFATVFFWMTLASLVPFLIWVPDLRTGLDIESRRMLLSLFAALAGAHVFVFGVQTALPREGWRWLGSMTRLLVIAGLAIGFFVVTLVVGNLFQAPGVFAWGGILAALGLLLIGGGYANWVERDFE